VADAVQFGKARGIFFKPLLGEFFHVLSFGNGGSDAGRVGCDQQSVATAPFVPVAGGRWLKLREGAISSCARSSAALASLVVTRWVKA
ncbi:hypothetical protein ACSTH6_00180, partial [Vibrio parahaemolyticus]